MSLNKNVFCFVWKIENFSMLPHQKGEKIESETFLLDAWKDIDFRLEFYPRGIDNEGVLSLFLNTKQVDVDLTINFTFVIESSAGPSRDLLVAQKNMKLMRGLGYHNFAYVDTIFKDKQCYLPEDTLSIRCEISQGDKTPAKSAESEESISFKKCYVSRTCSQIERKTITWPIKNMKKLMRGYKKTSFVLTSNLKTSPSLKLTLNTSSNDDCIGILIQQTCLSSEDVRLFAKCKITVMSAVKKHKVFKESTHLFKLDLRDVWQFPPFIQSSTLKNERYLYADDTLFLLCDFTFSYKDRIYNLNDNQASFNIENARKKTNIDELGSSIGNIFTNGKFSDIEIKAGGKTFPYYKVVLCARSPVFGAMFEHNMREANSNVVEITDVDPDTLKRMLEYMHTDVVEFLPHEDAIKLYNAADKYDVESLKRQCSVLLTSALSLDNVGELITLADAHQDDFLMGLINDFVFNQRNEVFMSTQWKNFMNDNPIMSGSFMHMILTGKNQA